MRRYGFTLAELLIALAILGVIAVFAIPKVLQGQQESKNKAIVKEAASIISGAYQAYSANNKVTSATQFDDFRQFINYTQHDNSGALIDGTMSYASTSCTTASGRVCLKLHNGATLLYYLHSFGGTGSTNAVAFMVDPDGTYLGTTASKSVNLYLYYNGRLADEAGLLPNTCNSNNCGNPTPSNIPPWFNWD